MKHKLIVSFLFASAFLASTAMAGTTWYVNGVNGSDTNNCLSATAACKTIGHAISLALSGDSIKVAPATYAENLSISISLKVIGSGASTTIIDGGGVSTVVTIASTSANVMLSNVTLQHGYAQYGAGIYNSGTLTLTSAMVTANGASASGQAMGGGIYNIGVLTINNSTIAGNSAGAFGRSEYAYGGGIANNNGKLTINRSTISGNSASLGIVNGSGRAYGGGIANLLGTLAINNSTLSGNSARPTIYNPSYGGGISSGGKQTINNTTISGNSATYGGGISGSATIQNSIVANNAGGNCNTTVTSTGYNLSSDGSCNFKGPGDMNNINPNLGYLQYNGGPTQTMALSEGSPAIDAGNPSGCTDGSGHLLKIDQRGNPRPDKEDTGGCDIGAYESQSD